MITHHDVLEALENTLGSWSRKEIDANTVRENLEILIQTSRLIKEDEQYPEQGLKPLPYDRQAESMSLAEARAMMNQIIDRTANKLSDTKVADQLMKFLNMYCNSFRSYGTASNFTQINAFSSSPDSSLNGSAQTLSAEILAQLSDLTASRADLLAELSHAKRQMHLLLAGKDYEWDEPQEETWQRLWRDGRYWRPRGQTAQKPPEKLEALSSRNTLNREKKK